MADILKIGRHGDVIIPRRVRAALDLKEGDELLLSVEKDTIVQRFVTGSASKSP